MNWKRGLARHFQIKPHERRLMLAMLPTKAVMAEIGVQYGYHADDMLRICEPISLDLVDIWTDERIMYIVRARVGNDPRATLLRMTSAEFFSLKTQRSYDALYIDGDHSYHGALADILGAADVVRDGGIICGDDYDWATVKAAVKDACRQDKRLRQMFWVWRTQWWLRVTK